MNIDVLEILVARLKDETTAAGKIRRLSQLHSQITSDVIEVLIVAADGVEGVEEDEA